MLYKPKRVLHVISCMKVGGVEAWLMNVLRYMNKENVQMEFCALSGKEGSYKSDIIKEGSKVILCPLKPLGAFIKKFSKILSDNNYDVVHSHVWEFSGMILKIAKRFNVPVRIAHSHTTLLPKKSLYGFFYSRYMRYLISKYATHRIGCSSEAAKALFGEKWQSLDNCSLFYCFIDIEAYRPDQPVLVKKTDFGIPSSAAVIGHVGSFRVAKNHTFILDIASEMSRQDSNIYFFFAGDGPVRKEMEDKARSLGIQDKIIFAGNRGDVPQLMLNVFDILLFPSLYEGMPLTLVQAAAAGLTSVCSDVITEEATNVMPDNFCRLSLENSAKQWAEAVFSALRKPRINHARAYETVARSDFSPIIGLKKMYLLYSVNSQIE